MRSPSLLDRLLGNGLVYVALWTVFLISAAGWLGGDNHTNTERLAPFISGFALLWATGSRRRVISERRWRQEQAAVTGILPGRAHRFGRMALAAIYVPVALALAYVVANFAAGMMGLPPGTIGQVMAGIVFGTRDMLLDAALAIAGGIVVLVAAGLLWRARAGRKRQGARRLPRGWDGTVKVLLPVPKE